MNAVMSTCRKVSASIVLALAVCLFAAQADAGERPPAAPDTANREGDRTRRKLNLVVLDFLSPPDSGALGKKVRQVVTARAHRSGRFITMAEMIQEEIAEDTPPPSGQAATPEKLCKYAREHYDADVLVWGEITSSDKGYTVNAHISWTSGETETASRPFNCVNKHLVVAAAKTVADEMLLKYVGGGGTVLKKPWEGGKTPTEQDITVVSQNLIANGDFEAGLEGWHVRGRKVSVVPSLGRGGHCLQVDVDKATAATKGVTVLTGYMPLERGTYYRLSFDVASSGSSVITWVRAYGNVAGDLREIYQHHKKYHSRVGRREWEHVVSKPFLPMHPKLQPDSLRVFLFVYWPAGRVRFDNIELVKVKVRDAGDAERKTRMREAYGEKGGRP